MCAVQRHFLGWDKSLCDLVADFILHDKLREMSSSPIDLSDKLIVVPTRQAGRRLKDALVMHCSAHKMAMLAPEIVMPSYFFTEPADFGEANRTLVLAIIADMFLHDGNKYPALIPPTVRNITPEWALRASIRIAELRDELCEGGFLIRDVVKAFASEMNEPERWMDLDRLENELLERLAHSGLKDPCECKIQRTRNPSLPQYIRHIIIAGVPDPTPLALHSLHSLSENLQIDILVHAPERYAEYFDEWGRPLEEYWQNAIIDIPDEQNIILVANQREQAQKVLQLLSRHSNKFTPDEVSIGVPDRSVIPFLEMVLSDIGFSTFDPAERRVADTSLYRLLASFVDVMREKNYHTVSTWLRHPDVLNYLYQSRRLSPDRVLAELDMLRIQHLPQSLEEMLSIVKTDRAGESYNNLQIALSFLQKQINYVHTRPIQKWLPDFLQTIYASKIIKQDMPSDAELMEIAESLYMVLKEFEHLPLFVSFPDLQNHGVVEALFLKRLGECQYHPQPPSPVPLSPLLEFQGWLELPWNDKPFLILTGMNDEFVPGGHMEHLFLPDALRTKLKLRNSNSRFARDAFVMTALIESRRSNGQVYFILGKNTINGDVLKPSRLFFLCDDKSLIKRARNLFAQVKEESGNFAPSISVVLNPGLIPELQQLSGKTVWHVTAFRDYLKCPFRFFLKHILRMERVTDDVAWLDSAQTGKLLHMVLEQLGRNPEMKKSCDAEQLKDFVEDVLKQKTKELYGNNPPLPVQLQIESLRWRLRSAAECQAKLAAEGWEILEVELPVVTFLSGVEVRGKIDRIDRHTGTGEIRIIDYKSSDSKTNPESTHLTTLHSCTPDFAKVLVDSKEKCWIDLQLPLYVIMLQQTPFYNEKFQLCYFHLPRTTEETGLGIWENFNEHLLRSAKKCAEEIINGILNGKFWPPADIKDDEEFGHLFPGKPELCFVPPELKKQR